MFLVFSIYLKSSTKLEKVKQTHKVYWLILVILASHLEAALQDELNTVYVRENGTAKLQWSLFIGENAGRSSVNFMVKKRGALLCQWVKAHWEVNQCDPGMTLTISPKQVRVPGPTNINVTFSLRNKSLVDDGTYEGRLVIDEKWQEMQVYPKYLVTKVEPVVTLNATYSNTCIADIICHARGGRPKPVETILIKDGTEISRSRLKCQEEAGNTDGNEASQCSSVHSIENSGGQYKCRVEHADYIVDSAEVDIPFGRKENETRGPGPVRNDCGCTGYRGEFFIPFIIALTIEIVMVIVMAIMLAWKILKHVKSYDRVTHVYRGGEREQVCVLNIEYSEPGIQVTDDPEEPVRFRTDKVSETAVLNQPKSVPSPN